jgi:demethylmenaquinone methyltransferase/2-methoxy-6-polyprenyl-1,4-benzoquinol methylase/phosphoethanolamine N-methyltransferase
MHGIHSQSKTQKGPDTAGITLGHATGYDLIERLMGLGVNRANSRMVVEMAEIQPGDRVLDVGCGTGSLTLTVRRYAGPAGAVRGIDASPEMIEAARAKARRSGIAADFEVGLIEQLAFPDGSFDAAISRLVVHHLPDDLKRRGFAEIFRVLKPGGRVFLADFNPPTSPLPAHVISALVDHRMLEATMADLPGLLTDAGFVEVSSGPTRASFLAFVSGKKPLTAP